MKCSLFVRNKDFLHEPSGSSWGAIPAKRKELLYQFFPKSSSKTLLETWEKYWRLLPKFVFHPQQHPTRSPCLNCVLYESCKAIIKAFAHPHWLNGRPVTNERWLTLAVRINFLYMSMPNPAPEITRMTVFIVTIYAYLWFKAKIS